MPKKKIEIITPAASPAGVDVPNLAATAAAQTPDESRVVVEVAASECPRCKSTNRDGYTNVRRRPYSGLHRGRTFVAVVWRDTRCTDCGRKRCDKTYEFATETPVLVPEGK